MDAKKIRIYDMKALFQKEGIEPFRFSNVAVFEGKNGVIVAENSAIHLVMRSTSDTVAIPANPSRERGVFYAEPQYTATLSVDEIKTAPHTEMTTEDFFKRCTKGSLCEPNYQALMQHLGDIGFDIHDYFPAQNSSLEDKIKSAERRRFFGAKTSPAKETSLEK